MLRNLIIRNVIYAVLEATLELVGNNDKNAYLETELLN